MRYLFVQRVVCQVPQLVLVVFPDARTLTVLLTAKSRQALLENIHPQRVERGDENVHPQVEFPAVDQQRVVYVPLYEARRALFNLMRFT